MALAETFFSNLQGGFIDLMQDLEKQYVVKFQNQEDTIKRLQQRVDELEQYSDDQKDNVQVGKLRVKSQEIDDLLDEIHQTDDNQEDKQDDDGNLYIYILLCTFTNNSSHLFLCICLLIFCCRR